MNFQKHILPLSVAITVVLLSVAGARAIVPKNLKSRLPKEFNTSVLSAPTTQLGIDSLRYPIKPRTGDFVSDPNNNNPFDLQDPPVIQQNIDYDPVTNTYIITETLGGQPYSNPTYMSFDDFWANQNSELQQEYWQQMSNNNDGLGTSGNSGSGGGLGNMVNANTSGGLSGGINGLPNLYSGPELFSDIFGSGPIEIRPTGNIDMELGFRSQFVDNPALPSSAQRTSNFLFDMGINMGVTGKIGDKLNLNLNYNTKATFNFDQQIKLSYAGKEDDIIQEINAGNVNFPLPTQLIPGSQNLFGLQSKLRFGRLTINSVVAQQRSQSKNMTLQNGTQVQNFEVSSDAYDDNRHFFLAHHFRDNYEKALENLPYINSQVIVTRVDVYVLDSRGNAQDVQRDIVAFADLGEANPNNPNVTPNLGKELPQNGSNNLYEKLISNTQLRELDEVSPILQTTYGLRDIIDFKKTQVRKLDPDEFTFEPKLGFISLNFSLRSNELLAVAYEYTTIFGGTYRVGELADNLFPVGQGNEPQVLYLKMLKSTADIPKSPMWDLMMKNAYSLGAYQIQPTDFQLDVLYENPGGGELRYIPDGEGIKGVQLIRLLNLDDLNTVGEQRPDGVFDYLEAKKDFEPPTTPSSLPPNLTGQAGQGQFGGQSSSSQNSAQQYNNTLKFGTINAKTGRIMFPVLEPFGTFLRQKFLSNGNTPELADKYVYDELYDSTKFVAAERAEYNRFVIRGKYKSNLSAEISLGAFDIPRGAVRVMAGGQLLREDVDYTVDYNLGRLTILNESILNAGTPINVSYEDNGAFGIQQRTYAGSRLDYMINKDFNIGATVVHLSERPFTPKVNYGDAPISNTMVGADMRYFSEMPWMTRALDALPLYSTKEPSTFTFNAEGAAFFPGTSKAIDQNIYIDDFEGSRSDNDLRFAPNDWILASTPASFEEAVLNNDLAYGFNRAKVAWYQIDNVFISPNGTDLSSQVLSDATTNWYSYSFLQTDLFPNSQPQLMQQPMRTFDLAFYPDQRGPYNFDTEGRIGISSGIDGRGRLKDPETRWGGVMRNLEGGLKDFERSNVEFFEFWVLDPFIDNPDNTGDLYLNFGNISEDVLRDAHQQFENGLPGPNVNTTLFESVWGSTPVIRPLVDGFGFNETRTAQDIGLDGLTDSLERNEFKQYYDYILAKIPNNDPLINAELENKLDDPAGDNYKFFRDNSFKSLEENPNFEPAISYVAERYKNFNGPQGNSPVQQDNKINNFSTSGTQRPDTEDLNNDNTLNDSEGYLEYRIPMHANMQIGETPYLANINISTIKNKDGSEKGTVKWYYFRVPIKNPTSQVGAVTIRNIESMRMYMTNFKQPVVMRFARLNLVRNNWRKYTQSLFEEGEYLPDDNITDSYFEMSSINFEENGGRTPIPYVIPPGIIRENLPSFNNISVLQNEQSIQLQVGQLKDGEGKGVFKKVDVDMRQFKNLEVFVHAESLNNPIQGNCEDLENDAVAAFIRIGDDFQNNFYEYEIPLKVTRPDDAQNAIDSTLLKEVIWPSANRIKIPLQELVDVKVQRNFDTNAPRTKPYSVTKTVPNTNPPLTYTITVVGSPDIGDTKMMMLGVRNPKRDFDTRNTDDGSSQCAEVWYNELRLTDYFQNPGYAAIARADAKLADLGTVTISGKMHTAGFGTLEQEVQDRKVDNYKEGNVAATLNLGRILPKNVGLQIPVYAGYTETISNPKYDPYDGDILLKRNVQEIEDTSDNATARAAHKQRQTATTTKSFNVTNLRKDRTKPNTKPKVWDIENWSATYAYTETNRRDPYVEYDLEKRHKGALNYTYSTRPAYIAPFSKLIKSKSPYLALIRDFNFNFVPTSVTLGTEMNRQVGIMQMRALSVGELQLPPIYEKYFTWDRRYGIKYNPFRSVTFDFNATNRSIIDEPQDGATPRDTLWSNIKRLGRTKQYTQTAVVSYNVPLDKIPFLSWTQLRTKYGSSYTWDGLPLGLADSLGNIVRNSQDIEINGELNFIKLYSSVPFLKKIDSPAGGGKSKSGKATKGKDGKDAKDSKEKGKKKDEADDLDTTTPPDDDTAGLTDKEKKAKAKADKKAAKANKSSASAEVSPAARIILRPLLSLRRVNVTFNQKNGTTLPGFTPLPRYLGSNWNSYQQFDGPRPGWDFLAGYQPELKGWLEWAAANNMLTPNQYLNEQVIQTKSTTATAKVNLEPLKDLRVDVNFNLQYSKNHNESYKTDELGENYRHFSKIDVGSYSVTTFMLPTMFDKLDTANISLTFKQFQANRPIIADRYRGLYETATGETLGEYVNPLTDETVPGYYEGYGPYSQDVLIPSFLSAYKGKNPATFNLNPFNFIPLPNWKVTYNGLSRLPMFKAFFTSFNLTHGYTSTLSINNFRNNIVYDDLYYTGAQLANDNAVMDYLVDQYLMLATSQQLDPLNNNFAAYFQIPQIAVSEQLSPLIGLDMAMKNGFSARFDYKKGRILGMSFQDYQLSESRSEEFTIGGSYKLTGVPINTKFAGRSVTLKNDIQFNFDFSIRDNVTTLYRLDQDIAENTNGMKIIRLAPSIDYIVNEKFRASLFYERTRNIPRVSTSFPIVQTRGGLRLNFSL